MKPEAGQGLNTSRSMTSCYHYSRRKAGLSKDYKQDDFPTFLDAAQLCRANLQ